MQADEDLEDSVSCVTEKSTTESTSSGPKRKKGCQPDFTKILTGAVQSIDKLSGSVIASNRQNDRADETMDDDWLFARSVYDVYVKLKAVPAGRDKEAFKLRMQGDLMSLLYGGQGSQLYGARSHNSIALQQPVYVRYAAPYYINSQQQQYRTPNVPMTSPMSMHSPTPLSPIPLLESTTISSYGPSHAEGSDDTEAQPPTYTAM